MHTTVGYNYSNDIRQLQQNQQGKNTMNSAWNLLSVRAARSIAGAALLIAFTASTATAETLMMPERDTRMGTDTVVWGVTTQANGTAYTLDCGDDAGTQNVAGNVADRSYITLVCNYPNAGLKTATLTVGAESDTVEIQVFDPATITDEENRSLGINMAIQDGLRFLWYNQENRAADFPDSPTTRWNAGGWQSSGTALVVTAFQVQGYQIPGNGSPPTDLYEKYVVQRGINYVIESFTTIAIGTTPQGDDPCVGVAADACTALYDRRRDEFHQSYTTGVAITALGTSGALGKVVQAEDVPGNLSADFVVGKSYGDIAQRLVNALAWGQIDGPSRGRGGWYYNFNSPWDSDGSTVGWVMLGLLDAQAAGLVVPGWVKTELAMAADASINDDGTLDYQSDADPASYYSTGPEKNGTGLQLLFFAGETGTARVDNIINTVDSWWTGAGGIGGNSWGCYGVNVNKACGYTMFNNLKGLKLQGVQTLPNVGRPAGPGAIPANDWHEDYKDWLVANQTNPTAATGGQWDGMRLSDILDGRHAFTSAIAEIILSATALVLPDPEEFARVGLQPPSQNRPIGGTATVKAVAVSSGGAPVPGATVEFVVLTGPNAGKTGSAITNADGEATFSYDDTGPADAEHADTVQAYIGLLESNIVDVNWTTGGGGAREAVAVGPATSLWALLLMIASLAVVGALVLRRP